MKKTAQGYDGVILIVDCCKDIVLRKSFYSVKDFWNCIEYVKGLLNSGAYELTQATCDFDKIQDANGKWEEDILDFTISCKKCGKKYKCHVDTYHGVGGFIENSK